MKHPLVVNATSKNVQEVVDKLEAILHSKNIQIFARINHAEGARALGLDLQYEEVIIFGDPKVGTYLMQECPALGLELPLKIVVWQAEKTFIGYRDPKLLLAEYEISKHRDIIEKMSVLMANLVHELVVGEH